MSAQKSPPGSGTPRIPTLPPWARWVILSTMILFILAGAVFWIFNSQLGTIVSVLFAALGLILSLVQMRPKEATPPGLPHPIVVHFSQSPSPPQLVGVPTAPPAPSTTPAQPGVKKDWGEAPHIEQFCGREQEQKQLTRWITDDRCKVIAVLGVGGVGKTTLATSVAHQVSSHFEYVIWRSLQHAPPPQLIVKQALEVFSDHQRTDFPDGLEAGISSLLDYLNTHRCLMILDNVESVMQEGQRAGYYRAGYEGYGTLLTRICETAHQSCLVFTSREKPKEVAHLQSKNVRTLEVPGIGSMEGKDLLGDLGIFGSDEAWINLVQRYSGNPLALKIISDSIKEIFGGNINQFLLEGETIFGDIHDLLDRQVRRLSPVEQDMLYWLALEREAVRLEDLQEDLVQSPSRATLLEALDSLRRRSLITTITAARFTLQPVVMDYLTGEVVAQVAQELLGRQVDFFARFALMKAQANEFVRNSQAQFVLRPLLDRLSGSLGREGTIKRIEMILRQLQESHSIIRGYAAGNALNLLIQFGCNLNSRDFSHLSICQAYLRGSTLIDVNCAHADFNRSIFTDTFAGILSITLSPQGDLLASGTANGDIRLWQASRGTPLQTLQGHSDGVWSVAFSPDGTLLASGSQDQTIRIWEIATGRCLHLLQDSSNRIWSIAFSPDGATLASGGDDERVRIWEVSSGRYLQTLQAGGNRIRAVAFSPDGTILASGGDDALVRLWNLPSGRCQHILRGHTREIRTLAFSAACNGTRLASGSDDQSIRIWEVSSDRCIQVVQGHSHWIRSVAWSPDGKHLASGSDDQTVRLWDAKTGHCQRVLSGHTNRVWSVTFSPDGQTLVSGGDDQTIRHWETCSGRCLQTLQGHTLWIWSVAFSPDGRTLVTGDQTVRLWDTQTGRCLRVLSEHTNRVRVVAFSPDGMIVASGSEDQTVRLWDAQTGRALHLLRGHMHWVRAVAFSPDGSFLATASDDWTVRLWDVHTGACIRIIEGHHGEVRTVAFSPDGATIVTGSTDHSVQMWETQTGHHVHSLHGHRNRVRAVAFSPDGSILASGSDDGTITLWATHTRERLRTLHGHASQIRSIAFSPDGSQFVTGSHDWCVRLWNTQTGNGIQILQGHSNRVRAVAFSPAGTLIASSSDDGTVKLWSTHTGTCERTLRSDRPYERMNITGARGLTEAQKASLKVLGAVEGAEIDG